MSRAQQGQVFQQAQGQANTNNASANTSFSTAQQDLGDYESELGQFKANNPYVTGGQAETAENQQLADTAAGGARAAGEALQSAAVRTGQNEGGAIAATEDIAAQNERALAGQEAGATQQRLAAETGYNEAGLEGQAKLGQMESNLGGEEAKAAQGELGTEEQAANTPSFLDELGSGIIQAGANFAGGFGAGYGKGLAGG